MGFTGVALVGEVIGRFTVEGSSGRRLTKKVTLRIEKANIKRLNTHNR